MENFVVGVFEDYAQARRAADALEGAGFSPAQVQLSPETGNASTGQDGAGTAMPSDRDAGAEPGGSRRGGLGQALRAMFGDDDDQPARGHYEEAVRRGNCVLTVDAGTDVRRRQAEEIVARHQPINLEERVGHWRSEGWVSEAEPSTSSGVRRAAGEGAAPPAGR
ncbi:MAG TPA: hypothetical protein VIM12_12035 [Noviherbaspirillum sp.]|uniref:hypothetical protein n=1 Tax=Noviherbaspirillum sp. TaxID=1926288 RepID=UPI002F93854C